MIVGLRQTRLFRFALYHIAGANNEFFTLHYGPFSVKMIGTLLAKSVRARGVCDE